MKRPGNVVAANRPPRLVTWLALLAFLLQGLIVQTHIHIASLEAAAPIHHGSQPAQKAPADCPACQLYAATAAGLVPHVITILLPLSWVESTFRSVIAIAVPGSMRVGWQSRAPPVR